MAARNSFGKVTVDQRWINRFVNFVKKPGNKLSNILGTKDRELEEITREFIDELRTQEIDPSEASLDSFLEEAAVIVNKDSRVKLTERETALNVYIEASEIAQQEYKSAKRLMVSNDSERHGTDIANSRSKFIQIKWYLDLADELYTRFNLQRFEGYDLADLLVVFDDSQGFEKWERKIKENKMDEFKQDRLKVYTRQLERYREKNRKLEKEVKGELAFLRKNSW